jgi:hypothetical protein
MQDAFRVIVGVAAILATSTAIAFTAVNPRAGEIVEFYVGHTHGEAGTIGAPAHSGGTDAFGCHNASVPYHCH